MINRNILQKRWYFKIQITAFRPVQILQIGLPTLIRLRSRLHLLQNIVQNECLELFDKCLPIPVNRKAFTIVIITILCIYHHLTNTITIIVTSFESILLWSLLVLEEPVLREPKKALRKPAALLHGRGQITPNLLRKCLSQRIPLQQSLLKAHINLIRIQVSTLNCNLYSTNTIKIIKI